MKYLVQVDGTNPKNWRELNALSPDNAAFQAVESIIREGHNPKMVYVAPSAIARHPNGAPIAAVGKRLCIKRNK